MIVPSLLTLLPFIGLALGVILFAAVALAVFLYFRKRSAALRRDDR